MLDQGWLEELERRVDEADQTSWDDSEHGAPNPWVIKTLISEYKAQADRIEALEAGLKPFAELARFWIERDGIHDIGADDTCATEIRFADLRHAAELLQKGGGDG